MKLSFAARNTDADIFVHFSDEGDIQENKKPFEGKAGQTLTFPAAEHQAKMIFVGTGKKGKLTSEKIRTVIAPALYKSLKAEGAEKASIVTGDLSPDLVAHLADALRVQSYEFKKYKTTKKETPELQVHFATDGAAEAKGSFEKLSHATDGVFLASDLANEPGNVLNPQTYAERIVAALSPLGVKVTILNQEEMKKLGMGSALAVGQGSETPPCMVVMEYNNAGEKSSAPLGLVGKGLTFDSGGISIKPAAGMGGMTLDMSGSAAVVGAMHALASAKEKVNVVAVVGLAENMPDGKSYRPGDILTSMSGKTIYVDNTDAEGRLVLCDALTYIQRTFNPHTVIDLATLTGAQVVALGNEFAAFYSNDKKLSKTFNKASAKAGENVWRMPLLETEGYAKVMKDTPLADLTNSGGRAGSCTAAAFLHQFIEKCKWIHIDMAGQGTHAGGVLKGWGVRLITQFAKDSAKKERKATKKKKDAKPATGGSEMM